MFVSRFPNLPYDSDVAGHRKKQKEANPAIQVYGRRFYKPQTEIEYLVEFFLVFVSQKIVGESGKKFSSGFPDLQLLKEWPEESALDYLPPTKIVLKLFTFLGSSQLESRHQCHQKRFDELLQNLKEHIEVSPALSKNDVLTWVEQVLFGFVGVAQNRAWSTQCFLPITSGLIAGETIWESSRAKKEPKLSWIVALKSGMFSSSKHVFLGRGGELLYLQLCNFFRLVDSPELCDFEKKIGFLEGTAKELQQDLESALWKFLGSIPKLEDLIKWVENADRETLQEQNEPLAKCGWCPVESWKETFFFAYEMRNVCNATLDPLEKVEMLKLCCVLQVMRTLCAQAARHWEGLSDDIRGSGGANGFAWIVTAQDAQERSLKELARRNLVRVQEIIHGVLRHSELNMSDDYNYKNADEQAQDLFVKLGKKIGFIVPWKGPGARFVMTEALLRYFVLALLPPGTRMTLRSFKETLFRHYGIGVNGEHLNKAIRWTHPGQPFELRSLEDDWLEELLRATGFLIPLSDAVSLVHNPFGKKDRA
ncbi:MAG: hypothetical protein GY801_32190 [bacterium]|nr:hypothetical protein [bacterium]